MFDYSRVKSTFFSPSDATRGRFPEGDEAPESKLELPLRFRLLGLRVLGKRDTKKASQREFDGRTGRDNSSSWKRKKKKEGGSVDVHFPAMDVSISDNLIRGHQTMATSRLVEGRDTMVKYLGLQHRTLV